MIPQRPEEPGKKYALALTILVHAGLLLVLFFGVQWKRKAPEVYEVELWSARPVPAVQVAPPPLPEPVAEAKPEPKPAPHPEPKKPEPRIEPPAPKKPDIALKEEKKKPEPKKHEPEPKKPEPKPEPKKPDLKPEPKKPEPKVEPKKAEPKPEPKKSEPRFDFDKELAKESAQLKSSARANAENAQRLANAAAAEAESRASASKRGLDSYINKIRGKIRGNIVLPLSIQGNPEAVFEVSQLPSGEVLEVKLKRSSGNSRLDAAIETAIRKSSPLPKPDDPALFERTLTIKYRPFEE